MQRLFPIFTFALIALLAALIVSSAGTAYAFHEGGVGECEGCHAMHSSSGGLPVTTSKFLLRATDQSSVCLNCHQNAGDTGPTDYHVSTADVAMPAGSPPRQLTPGGDFGWLKKNYIWVPILGAAAVSSPGDAHGHNISAQDYGYYADSYRTSSPGGTYPSAAMGCISCHDPHGKYRRNQDGSTNSSGAPVRGSGSYASSPEPNSSASVGVYRLLGGVGYYPKSMSAGVAFSYNSPLAVAPDTYNRSESTGQTRVAYGSGMSEWCRNCHTYIHTDATPTILKHPAGSGSGGMPPDMRTYYDRYIKSGDLTGAEESAYLSLVPFEVGTSNAPLLKSIVTSTPTKGPSSLDGTPAVMCLSCHRAHASGWDKALRWNNTVTAIVHEGKYAQEGQPFQPFGQGRSEAEALHAYYDIPASSFATEQTPLCYKCHATGSN